MRKTRKIAVKIQSIITCFVLFMSVFFYAGMNVEASGQLVPLTSSHAQISINSNFLLDGLNGPVFSSPVSLSVRNSSLEVYQISYRESVGGFYEVTNSNYAYYYDEFTFSVFIRPPSSIPFGSFYTISAPIALDLDFSFPGESLSGSQFYTLEPIGVTSSIFGCYDFNGVFFLSPLLDYSFRNQGVFTYTFKLRLGFSVFRSGSSHPYSYYPVIVSLNLDNSFDKVANYTSAGFLSGASSSYTDGYVNGSMGSTSTDLNNSLSGYEQAEGSLFTSANQGVGSFQMQSLNTPALVSSMSFVSTFLQSIYTSSGGLNGLGLLPAVVFTFTFASIVVGLYRYYGGGKSG